MSIDTETKTLDHGLSLDLYAVTLYAQRGAAEDHVHAIADSRLSLRKLKLLHILARPHRRPPRIARVGELVEMDASHASRAVNELDQERLVDRIPDEEDKRGVRVAITPKGRDLLEQLDRVRIRHLEQFIGTLTATEKRLWRAALRESLKRPEVAALRPPD